jgi:hypothetical protein
VPDPIEVVCFRPTHDFATGEQVRPACDSSEVEAGQLYAEVCPGCGSLDGDLPTIPCLDHGTQTAVADVPGITSCIDCGRRLSCSGECPVCEQL